MCVRRESVCVFEREKGGGLREKKREKKRTEREGGEIREVGIPRGR